MRDLEVIVLPDAAEVARVVADESLALVEAGACRSLMLAGGTTPRTTYQRIAERGGASRLDVVDIFFGDERMVPPSHADSNFAMAEQALFAPLGLGAGRVHRIPGELGAAAAAAEAERALTMRLGPEPVLDLALLGLGSDGHTASLFPGDPPGAGRWFHPARGGTRVSASFELLTRARAIVFVATGEAKAAAVASLVTDQAPRGPAADLVARSTGIVRLVVDRAAASRL